MDGNNNNRTNPSPQDRKSITEVKNRNDKVYKGTILTLVIVIGVLTFMLITSRQALDDVSTKKTVLDEVNLELEEELNSVLAEYNTFKNEYDSVLTQRDSVIRANAQEIETLIAQQTDYRRVRRQLNRLREITQEYVHEMDSLYTVNEVLKAENVEMQEEIQRFTRQTTELTETKTELEGRVEEAAALRAYQVDATPIRLRGRRERQDETDRARRTDLIQVCFIVGENPVAEPGLKNAYVRIADPDGEILRISDDDMYSFVIGQDTLQYSMKGEFNYINQDKDICLYWQQYDYDYEEGLYLVSVFTDEFRLGETQFSLR